MWRHVCDVIARAEVIVCVRVCVAIVVVCEKDATCGSSVAGNGSRRHFDFGEEDTLRLSDGAATQRAALEAAGARGAAHQVAARAERRVDVGVHAYPAQQLVL